MAKTFDQSAGIIIDNDYGYFDGPDPDIVDVIGQGIATAEVWGTAKLRIQLYEGAFSSSEVFGIPEFTLHIKAPAGVQSLEAFGTGEFIHHLFSAGIASIEGFGAAKTSLHVFATGLESVEGFGVGEFTHHLYDVGIASGEVVVGGDVYKQWATETLKGDTWSSGATVTATWTKDSPIGASWN